MNGGQNLESLKRFIRAANYLTVSQIFLQDNFLLERDLRFDDIKPRLLGHWGSCPGVNHVYAHLLDVQKQLDFAKSGLKIAFMLGPGHAFPALQANLFLEETLLKIDKNAVRNSQGIAYISKNFSWPGGFPSHASPFTPGVILEGGELGYSLSTAFGAILDNPNLVMTTLIGDGEAETGPIAAAWHLNKLINPVENGVVLPVLHLNGYKISGPTIFGSMSDFELIQFFHGAGWEPKIVDEYSAEDFDLELSKVFSDAFQNISRIKFGRKNGFARLPMIIMRSKKGSSGVAENNGEKIEGNSLAHQVPLLNVKSDEKELKKLEDWLKSYKFEELFDFEKGEFKPWLNDFLPEKSSRIGQNRFVDANLNFTELKFPEIHERVGEKSLAMNAIGDFLKEIFEKNPENFRFFSPDETYSNKLDAIFKATSRSWQREIKPWEKDLSKNGRVTEILSEHSLQGLLQGYILTGRHGVLTSYESFAPIISSMMDQYAKFLAQSREVEWRGDLASLNYILTSTGWRQDHNGFSHQNPSFIDEVLRRENGIGQIFLPADDNSAVAAISKMLKSRNNINVLVAGKTPEPRYFSLESTQKQLENGGIFVFDSWRNHEITDWNLILEDDEPDLILAASGDYVFKETVAALQVLLHDVPQVKIRLVYVQALCGKGIGTFENTLSKSNFVKIFTKDKPVIFVFHGYAKTLKSILFDYENPARIQINGYEEKGSTTTPFDMLARNRVSRYDIAVRVLNLVDKGDETFEKLVKEYQKRKDDALNFARENSVDAPEIENWNYLKFD
ncbi:MAG: phosphoketolase family protein [bacterium]|nr:phosphoketolase family protein [bacterium]